MRLGMKTKAVTLTEGVIWKQLLLFAAPLLVSNILQQMYNTVDLMIVGQYVGSDALAAVGSTGPLFNLLIGFFTGLSVGAGIVIAQYYGARMMEDVNRSVHTAVAVALLVGGALTLIGLFFSPTLLRWMQTPEEILDQAVEYLRVLFIGMIPTTIYNMGAGILRAVSDAKRPLYYLAFSCVANLGMDILFVKGFGMGVGGAALATVIAQVFSVILVLANLMGSDMGYRLNLRQIRLHRDIVSKIIKIGVPAGMQSVVISLSNVLMQSQVNLFGPLTMGGYAAANRLDGFQYMILNAFVLSTSTFVGQNLGAGRYDRAKQGIRVALGVALSAILCLSLILFFFGPQLLSIFNDDPAVIDYGYQVVRLCAMFYWIFTIGEVLSGAIKGSGDAFVPMCISMVCMCGLRILWIFVGLRIWYDIRMVFLCYPVAWVTNASCLIVYYLRGKWLVRFKGEQAVGLEPVCKSA